MAAMENLEGILLLLGAAVLVAILMRTGLGRVGLPALVGYLLLGFCLRLADARWDLLSEQGYEIFHFLAKLGLFALLFRVGLKGNLAGLLGQLKRASVVWTGDVLISGLVGFLVAYFLLSAGLITSLIVAAALTATSVGVSVSVWQDAGQINSPKGQLLTDVAELDDLTGVMLLALLSAVLPAMHSGSQGAIWPVVASTLVWVLLKLALVIGTCLLFSRYVERPVTEILFRSSASPSPTLGVVGIALMIAAVAALLGLSLAIGAFLAGLAFSRDPRETEVESSFEGLYEFFAPFFFIGIGLRIEPGALAGPVGAGFILLLAAILGKLVGVFFTAASMTGKTGAMLLAVSMIPRAEIAMVIMQQGQDLGNWAVPADAFAAMVVVSAGTCMLTPLVLRPMLNRWGA